MRVQTMQIYQTRIQHIRFQQWTSLCLLLGVVLWGHNARAEEKSAEPGTWQPGFDVNPELKKRFEKQRSQHRPVVLSQPEWTLKTAQPAMSAEGRLHRLGDGIIVLATPVAPEQEAVLINLGAQRLLDPKQISDHTLFGGEYFRTFQMSPELSERPLANQETQANRKVRLQLSRTQNGRPLVVALNFL